MRKVKFVSVFVLLVLLLSLVVNAVVAQGPPPSQATPGLMPGVPDGIAADLSLLPTSSASASVLQEAYVHFAAPVTIETALNEAVSYGLKVIELRHSVRVMEQDIQGGYFPQAGLPSREIAQQYEQAYAGSIASLIRQAKDAFASASDAQTQRVWQHQLIVLELAQVRLRESGFKVVGMMIQGEATTISAFAAHSPLVSEIEVVPSPEDANKSSDPRVTWVNPNTWLPTYGSIHVHPYNPQDTERYVTQWMHWTNVSGFGSNSAYEHDFYLYNYDGKTYLSRDQWPNGIPKVTYWGSNLPSAYLDTRLCDPAGEVAYVIGCANGDAIQPNTAYWSQIRTAKGDANRDEAKLFGQLGHRSPHWCYSTWCVFADQTEPIVGSWSNPWAISIPGDLWWNR